MMWTEALSVECFTGNCRACREINCKHECFQGKHLKFISSEQSRSRSPPELKRSTEEEEKKKDRVNEILRMFFGAWWVLGK